MSTQTKNYIHLHIHVHHIIQLPETQDPNSSFTTAPGSAALFDGAVGESPPADLSPGGASAPHWLGRAAPRDLLLQAEKAFLRKMIWIHNLCRFSGHGLLIIMDLDLEISIPPVKAFGAWAEIRSIAVKLLVEFHVIYGIDKIPLLQASLARFPKRIENLGGEQMAMWRYFCFSPSPSPSQRKQQRRMKKASKSIHKI